MDNIQPISTFIYALLYSYCLLNLYKLINNLAVFIVSAFKERTHSVFPRPPFPYAETNKVFCRQNNFNEDKVTDKLRQL